MQISRTSRISLGLALVLATAAVAFAQKVTTDHASGVNFSQYKTFQWIKEPKTSNPLVRERVIADVNSALESHGLKLVESDGDLAVAAHAATTQERTLETFYDGFPGGWRWNSGFGTATTSVRTYEVGTLVIDLFDAHTKEAVWRGTSTKTLSGNPQKNTESLNKAIAKMFKEYPPTHHTAALP